MLRLTCAILQSLFHNDGLFIERYFPRARHVEVQVSLGAIRMHDHSCSPDQVFGDGKGHAFHMGERECSVQKRHQKVIEEAPSPFMMRHPGMLPQSVLSRSSLKTLPLSLDVQARMCADAPMIYPSRVQQV